MHYIVRPMRTVDIPQVTEIDREAFPTECSAPPYDQRLSSRLAHYLVSCEAEDRFNMREEASGRTEGAGLAKRVVGGLKSRSGGLFAGGPSSRTTEHVVGFVGFWLMLGEAHIVDIAVRETHRGKGIGELLLLSAVELAVELGAGAVTLEVRASNHPAQALYRKYGIIERGRRHGYYADNGEDALIMTAEGISSASYQVFFQRLKEDFLQKWAGVHEPVN